MPAALEHRMTGLLWSRVRAGEAQCSPNRKEQLATADLLVRSHHGRIWQTMASISSVLGTLDVEFAVIKGVPAEARWYDRVGERPSRDLDLLIAPHSLSRVTDVVDALHPHHPLREELAAMFERGLGASADLVVDGIAVDLHLDLFQLGLPGTHPDQLWAHTTPFALPDGGQIRVLDAELSLVHFLLHLNKDSFCWLLGFADVARILDREEIDWHVMRKLVAGHGLDVPVWSALAAVTQALGLSPVSDGPTGWRAQLWRVLWRPSVQLQGDVGWTRFRHRADWLPVVANTPATVLGRWACRRVVLSPAVAVHANPGRRGPWWWRLIRGRLGRMIERRRAVRRLRSALAGPRDGHGRRPDPLKQPDSVAQPGEGIDAEP